MGHREEKAGGPPATSFAFCGYRLTEDCDLLYRGDDIVPLEPKPVRVLRYLVEHRDRIVGKTEILDRVWADRITTEAVVKQAIAQIRRVLGDDPKDPRFVATFHRRGYRFIADLEERVAIVEAARPAATESDGGGPPTFSDALVAGRLVGRTRELEILRREMSRIANGRCPAHLIVGELGVGKTRLVQEIADLGERSGIRCVEMRFFHDEGLGQSDRSLLDLIDGRRALAGGTGPDLADSGPGADRVEPRLDRAEVCRRLLLLGEEAPAILAFEDLQWASEESLQAIAHFLRARDRQPLLPLLIARRRAVEDPFHPLAGWMQRVARHQAIHSLEVGPLDQETSREFIESCLGGAERCPGLPAIDLARLHDLTGGNPYFLSEMVRWLVVQGVLQSPTGETESWRWNGLQELELPHSLSAIARSRLEELEPSARHLLGLAAVLGEAFRLDSLAELAGGEPLELERLLGEAVQRGVVASRHVPSDHDYRFQNELLRTVCYEQLTPHRRRSLHSRVAELLGRRPKPELAQILSRHHEAAGEWTRTFLSSREAMHRAKAERHWPSAVALGERAVRALERLGEEQAATVGSGERAELLMDLGEAYSCIGRLKHSEEILRRALESPNLPCLVQAECRQRLSRTLTAMGSYEGARREAATSLELLEPTTSDHLKGVALLQIGTTEVAMGAYLDAGDRIESAMSQVSLHSLERLTAQAMLGWVHALRGSFGEALRWLRPALDEVERSGDARLESVICLRLHWVELSRGEFEDAWELASRARTTARRIGDLKCELKADMGLGQVRVAQGLVEWGLPLLTRVLGEFEKMGDLHHVAEAQWLSGRALAELGAGHRAMRLLDSALSHVRRLGDRDDEFRISIDVARLQRQRGKFQEAIESAQSGRTLARQLGCQDGEGLARVEEALAFAALGQENAARESARTAHELLQRSGSGELWRSAWALASLERDQEARLRLLRESIGQLEEQVGQLSGVGEAQKAQERRAGPAADLVQVLESEGRTVEAEDVRRRWRLGSTET